MPDAEPQVTEPEVVEQPTEPPAEAEPEQPEAPPEPEQAAPARPEPAAPAPRPSQPAWRQPVTHTMPRAWASTCASWDASPGLHRVHRARKNAAETGIKETKGDIRLTLTLPWRKA
jgi:hypothetical protein